MEPGPARMTQELSYRLEFAFSGEREDRDQLLPVIDLFLRSLEEADRTLAGALGLELDYRRSLRDMGASSFRYAVSLVLHWPRQILLGPWPERASLRTWMDGARAAALDAAVSGRDADELAASWHDSAVGAGLSESLVYIPPSRSRLEPLLEDLGRAVRELGGREAVRLG